MDKEEFLNLLNSNNYIQILFNYCIENGKNHKDTEQFIQLINLVDLSKQMITACINTAVQYYKNKFDIITIINIENNKIITNY